MTHDELWHLPVGLLNLQQADFHFDRLNPPLTRMWCALPLWISRTTADSDAEGSAVGSRFLELHPENFQQLYFFGRILNIILSVATVLLLALWAGSVMGETAAVLTTLMYVSCPNILAHASIVTPDTGLMLGFVATLFQFSRWSRQRSWKNTLLLAAAIGLTQATKFTAVILYPVLLTVWFSAAALNRRSQPSATDTASVRCAWLQFPVAVAVSLVVLNSVYLWHGSLRPLKSYSFQSTSLQELQALSPAVSAMPVPLPEDYLLGLDQQRAIMEGAHPVFLDGQWSVTGFSDYYPRTLLYKLSHPVQALLMLGGLLTLFRRTRRLPWCELSLIGIISAVLLGIASTTAMQLGIRYVLPILPLLMLIAGQIGSLVTPWPKAVQRIAGVIIAAGCLCSLRFHPHHLAYFNEYAGGPIGGRQHLLDSNIDWGQDLHLVREFMKKHQLQTIRLAYFGTVPPQMVGIDYTLPPGLTPETRHNFSLPPGYYAVSMNYVMGRPHIIHEPDGSNRSVGPNEFGYFRTLNPTARLGYSIDVYRIGKQGLRP
ncbi:MAG: glycosyltransferase family 39 protein [Planctomycetaceae bacterium]|nr:glycosyltransferase family 39 protein [Planctomycetaceae bacterium]